MVSKKFSCTFRAFAALIFSEFLKSLAIVGWHPPMRISVVFIPSAPAPLVPKNRKPFLSSSAPILKFFEELFQPTLCSI